MLHERNKNPDESFWSVGHYKRTLRLRIKTLRKGKTTIVQKQL